MVSRAEGGQIWVKSVENNHSQAERLLCLAVLIVGGVAGMAVVSMWKCSWCREGSLEIALGVSRTMPSTQLTLPLPPAQAATTCNDILLSAYCQVPSCL